MATDTHPTDCAPVIRWGQSGPELVEMRWGLKPRAGVEPVINIRTETADLSGNRCLVPATELDLFTGAEHPKRHWKVTLKGESIFFFGGV
jgi:putative SOS response-associated peptidase YedK